MNPWPELVKIALLGVHKQLPKMEEDDSPLGGLISQLPEDKPENLLLSAAGSATIYQQIGGSPIYYPPEVTVPAAAPDPRPTCDPAMTRLLARIVTGPRQTFLKEYLDALNGAGYRLPASLVPNILSVGFKKTELRPLIIPLLSPADRQLAASHPNWIYAGQMLDTWIGAREIWHDLSQVGKTRLIQQVRRTHPSLARELVESSWKVENDNARINFIKSLASGLSLADEPFLEMALDDRSNNVRRRAGELLAAIPGSRLGKRMAGYSARFFSWSDGSITIRFPEVTAEMVRDGVYGVKSKKLAHVRSKQFIQLIGAVPLSHWTSSWAADPQTIVQAAMATNWKRTITSGFADAAVRQKDPQWARAVIWARGPDMMPTKLIDILEPNDYTAWLQHVRGDDQEALELNSRNPLFKSINARSSLAEEDIARTLFPMVAAYFCQEVSGKKVNMIEQRAFSALAYRCPVTVLPEVEALFGDFEHIAPPWQPTAESIIEILRFRKQMLEIITRGK